MYERARDLYAEETDIVQILRSIRLFKAVSKRLISAKALGNLQFDCEKLLVDETSQSEQIESNQFV